MEENNKEIRNYAERIASKKIGELEEGYNILKEKEVKKKTKELCIQAEKIISPMMKKVDELTKKANKELFGKKIKILAERKYDYDGESDIMVFRPFQINIELDIRPEMFEGFVRLQYDIENKKKLEDATQPIKVARDKVTEALFFKDKNEQEKLLEELKKL